MPELEVPGAGLHYEAVGSGPMLLGIHGGDGSGNIWKFLGEELKDRFTVVFYDRELEAGLLKLSAFSDTSFRPWLHRKPPDRRSGLRPQARDGCR